MRTDQHHVVAGEKRAHYSRFDFAMLGNSAHLQVVCDNQMLITKFPAQQVRDDVAAERCRFQQATRNTLEDVDVREAAVTYHYATHAIVLALKKFNVGSEVLGHQVIMRQAHHRHLLMRVDFAGADTRKVFETTHNSGLLQPAQVDGSVAKHFTGRASE